MGRQPDSEVSKLTTCNEPVPDAAGERYEDQSHQLEQGENILSGPRVRRGLRRIHGGRLVDRLVSALAFISSSFTVKGHDSYISGWWLCITPSDLVTASDKQMQPGKLY